MTKTASLHSRMTLLSCLPILVYRLESYPCSLSDSENDLRQREWETFVILVAENTEKYPEDHIITLLSLVTMLVAINAISPKAGSSALNAIYYMSRGEKVSFNVEPLNNPLRLMSRDTSRKSGQQLKSLISDTLNLLECPYVLESDLECVTSWLPSCSTTVIEKG